MNDLLLRFLKLINHTTSYIVIRRLVLKYSPPGSTFCPNSIYPFAKVKNIYSCKFIPKSASDEKAFFFGKIKDRITGDRHFSFQMPSISTTDIFPSFLNMTSFHLFIKLKLVHQLLFDMIIMILLDNLA